MKTKRRPYTLRARAASQAETRKRIVEAAAELHRKLGPAETSLTAVAERAGVQRHTLYRHFPSEADLLRACREHFVGAHPFPNAARWADLPAGPARVRTALTELYAYYSTNRSMLGNVLRDSDRMPVGGGFRQGMSRAAAVLAGGWPGARSTAARAALELATDFYTWRSLADGSKLEPAAAAAVMSRMVSAVCAD
ncbi:MAG: TetR/AcrR family transcriptional regulator [Chloroflexota bacterium]|nr:TetR/AcrR family transcriptional regulator [Chloroflexota bacterium]